MVFEHIEKLKCEYTDKYVVVDDSRPELRRFGGRTGTVRTVNVNGRALVEFDGLNNIGWYDIDVDFLRVIDQPLPATEEKEPPKPPAKAPSALEKARGDQDDKAASGKPSVADVLAAARTQNRSDAKSGKASKTPVASSAVKMSTADILAAARTAKGETTKQPDKSKAKPTGGAAEKPAGKSPSKMSTADILAAARAKKSAVAKGAEKTEEAPPAVAQKPATGSSAKTSTAEILAA
ncbi:MAG: hypothetical protein ACC628_05265, partial [Pirellulaceae bacterium]